MFGLEGGIFRSRKASPREYLVAVICQGDIYDTEVLAGSANCRIHAVNEFGPRVQHGSYEHVARYTPQGVQLNMCSHNLRTASEARGGILL